MKIKGITFFNSGYYKRVKILDDSVIVDGNKYSDMIKTGKKFSDSIRGLDDKTVKEEIINKFIIENRIDYLSDGHNRISPIYEYLIGARNNRELYIKSLPSVECRNTILIKYLSDRYDFLLNNLDSESAIVLHQDSISQYDEEMTFRLASKYGQLYEIEKDFIKYIIDVLYDGKEIEIKRNTIPGIYQEKTESYDIIGLKKKLKIDNSYSEYNYIFEGNNAIIAEVKKIIEEYNNNYRNAAKLQLKMEEFK